MTKQLGIPDLVDMANAGGAQRSAWWRIGQGPWYGTVVDAAGVEWEVEQRSTTWTATSSTQAVVTKKTVEQLLKQVGGG
jgi:hypothetical protein